MNALNVINPSDYLTGHAIQLKLTLKTQAQLVHILVQTVSGVIQGVVALAEKEKNYSKIFEMYLEGLNIAHEKMKGSIGERIHLITAESEPSVWVTAVSILEKTDLLEKLANNLDAHVSRLE